MARFSRNSIVPAIAVASVATAVVACALALAPAAAARPAGKLVRYHGYAITVPAGWPIYRLSSDPFVCVRFDRHAVYLGSPSPTQRCPAHAVGRTEAILISPLAASGARAGSGGGATALPPVTSAGAQRALGASARLAIPAHGVTVTATWGSDPASIEHALHLGWPRLMRAGSSGGGPPGHRPSRAGSGPRATSARRQRSAMGGLSVTAGSRGTTPVPAVFTGRGFDACSAPSGSQMTAWAKASPYRAAGIYIGGTNMACSQPNLTSAWVSAEAAAGWYLIPTYVGLQAPTSGCGCSTIVPKQAAAEGTAAALDAVTQAQAVGLGPGTPIYFDMEAYTPSGKSTKAVLTFLAAWTTQLHAAGYVSGVYSSGASGIADLVASYGTSYVEPDDIWIADWNNAQTTSDPYVPAADWANHQRVHQYQGGHNETHGGVTINIDGNYLDVQTTGGWTPPPDGTFVQQIGASQVYRLAGGAPLYVSNWTPFGGPQTVSQLAATQFKLLKPFPAGGTFVQTTTGGLYVIAGGAPLWVSSWSVYGVPLPYTLIDQWDIDNITNPLAHLRPVPANGTWLTTPAGQIYHVAGGTPFPVASWTPYGGPHQSVLIDPWDIQNISSPQSHLLAAPVDGTVVEGLPSATYWVFKGGKRQQVGHARGAVRVDDTGLAPFRVLPPAVMCVVPRLNHLTLRQARRKLRRSHCRLGKVGHTTGGGHLLRVIGQSPRPRTKRQPGYAVRVFLG